MHHIRLCLALHHTVFVALDVSVVHWFKHEQQMINILKWQSDQKLISDQLAFSNQCTVCNNSSRIVIQAALSMPTVSSKALVHIQHANQPVVCVSIPVQSIWPQHLLK